MILKKLFIKYKSDKHLHKYDLVYDQYFTKLKNKKLTILEIGVSNGSSLKAWSNYFRKSKIVGIDIKKIDIFKKKLNKKNIFVHQGSQTDNKFINQIVKIYKKFDIIIDDGSHFPKDVIKSFKLLFHSLDNNGLYFVEDTQTSYNHFLGGNAFDLKYANTHVNFFKHLTDSLNYKEIANPFYLKNGYDGLIKNISFFNNIIVILKGKNDNESNEVLDNSYEKKRFITKIKRNNQNVKYFVKYKIFYSLYTLFLFFFSFLKKIILFRS